ncbi:MAG TPA: PilW family protein [Usitatibacter sp.]|nr:PilW family protein [Usitatibacter sp.]
MNLQRTSVPRRSMQGLSLVELMIAMVLGLVVLAALVSVFANTSASRAELERTSRQVENGRYAMELLGEELRHAGFYGEANVSAVPLPGVMPDPCSTDPVVWKSAMPLHVVAYDNGAALPACFTGTVKANTDVLLVRRLAACEAGSGDCPAAVAGDYYAQIAKCAAETPITPIVFDVQGSAAFNLHMKNCTAAAGLRKYLVRFYYIGTDNGSGQNIPTLRRLEMGAGGRFIDTPLVEGIDQMNLEYGLDSDEDGVPDVYTADPPNYVCGICTNIRNWSNVVSVRVNLLARNLEASPGYTDTKTYTIGRDAAGAEITVSPADAFRRHAYTGLIRVVNAGERRDLPQ